MLSDGTKIKGKVKLTLTGPDGKVKEQREIDNLVVDTGLEFIASRMAGVSSDVMSHMAIGAGTTAPAAGDTDLESILGIREAIDTAIATGPSIAYTAGFEAGEGTGAVTEAGLFNAATLGTMLCRTTFPVVNKQADDTLSIVWTITLSAS